MLKEGSQYICPLVILIESVFRTGKNFYPQVFLERCELCCQRKKEAEIYYISLKTEISSDEFLLKKILMK